METGHGGAFVNVGLAVAPGKASGTQAAVAISPVDAFPAILARVGHTLVHVDIAPRS